jgi:hypothetical protein
MSDPMPPESDAFTSGTPPVGPTIEEQSVTNRDDRQKYDELIAVVVALLGIGSILFWVWGRSSPLSSQFGSGNLGDVRADAPRQTTAGSRIVPPTGSKVSASAAGGLGQGIAALPQGDPDQHTSMNERKAQAPAAAPSHQRLPGLPAATTPPVNDAPAVSSTATPSASPEVIESDTLPNATAPRQFSDVPANSPLAPYVDALSSRGVLGLFDNGTLNPDTPITRGEFANLVSRAFGKPRIQPAIAFSDVPTDDVNQAAVEEATRTGFMSGFPDATFKPSLNIPRYQMQVALVTGTQLSPSGDPVQVLANFPDRQMVPKWAVPKVATAVSAKILPTPNNAITDLKPTQVATRGEAIVMLHAALVKEGKLPPVK